MADPADALGLGDERLDDYENWRERGTRPPSGGHLVRIVTVVGALIVGYLLAVSFTAGRSAALIQDERKAELVALVREQREDVVELNATLADLGEELSTNEQEAAALVPALSEVLQAAELQAGVTAVTGPGLTVTLFDAPADCAGAPYLCRIQDYDLQQAVNTLFAAGAEAVSVGPQRIISTTAIRSAGSQITANYRFLAAPYEIRAVGGPEDLEAAMHRDGLAASLEAAGTGLRLEMRRGDDLEVPGVARVPAIRVARPVGDVS